jgi:hypothetical protein
MMAFLVEAAARSMLLGLAVGLGLKLLRVRNPQVEMTAWITVLAASLAMPLLMRMVLLRLPAPMAMLPHVALATDPAPWVVPVHRAAAAHADWLSGLASGWSPFDLLPIAYGLVVSLLVLRLVGGLMMTWQIVRNARPIRAEWTRGADVRVTARILAPVTFGRVILVPISFIRWSPAKRRAVMGHELSHVVHHDFTAQVLSQLHSAIFWFSPFAWWLQVRLAALAETTSDEAAIANVGDRVGYAEILLDIAVGARNIPAGIAMARPALLRQRIEHILSQAAPVVALTPGRRILLAAALLPAALLIGGTSWHARAADLPALAILAAPPWAPADPGHARPFAILTGGHSMISADGGDIARLLGARDKVGGEAILFLADDTLYGVTDPALVEQAADLFRPENDMADRERDAADEQKELAQEQADLGREQADVGRKMSDVAKRYSDQMAKQSVATIKASTSDLGQQKQDFKDAMADLAQQQRELGREQGRLGAQQAKLGVQQQKLGREQSRVAHEGDMTLTKLLDASVADGAAKPVR